ncbi:putative MFS family arabinose efflux permease [Asanoa ferruginea]|uniref:Putative MFS family arabinose efflux permease n=1 Tax=Asanoa ferruginea TaxID=53367 RepID=A0A3E0A463_9ACTN|nr:MFS transporter [Asanoa ferruginea]REG01131.1 putative MFS family arabinose efflux permease [Asanoa ferruginea]GIF47167.1 MFS transporter [Asanoa ferruginea]
MSRSVREPAVDAPRSRSSAGYVLALLFIGNLLNFYDRALPSVVLEPIKDEYGLDDTQVGILASAFVLVAAIAGVPLGRLADRVARRTVAGWGLFVWSVFTAAGGVLTNFWGFLASRVGVGVGESSYAPATGSLLADLYPSERRSRANALFMLGFPIGTLLAFLTAGALAEAFDSWRAPFLIAAVPGVIVALLVLRIREPRRGAADPITVTAAATRAGSLRSLLKVRSMYGLILAFAGYNFAAYAIGTFLTPVLQRYYGLELVAAGLVGGVVIGVTGLIGLLLGGRVLDGAARRSPAARVRVAAVSLGAAAVFALAGLVAGPRMLWQLVLFLSLGYLLGIVYLAAAVPVLADVIRPEQRSGALGLMFAIGYLLGGAGGPIVVGMLSDALAAGSSSSADAEAQGLQTAMMIAVPAAFAVAALGMFLAARFVKGDRETMLAGEAAA